MTVVRLGWWAATVALAVAFAPPVDPPLDHGATAVPLGICAGAILFAALARKRFSPAALANVPRERLLARTLVLATKAAHEEAVWRAVVLGFLVAPIGRAGALVVSTCLFAAAHVNRLGARATQHLATGLVFGIAYLATGRLGASIGAHATYNVLIGAGLLSRMDMSTSATSVSSRGLIRSSRSPRRLPTRGVPVPAVPAPIASLASVSKSFGAVRALDEVDLELRPGEILALLGPNGAGKSTAVSLLLGLRRPDSGRALLHGRDPRDPEARRSVGVVLQNVGFPLSLRVRETVDFVRAHFPEAPSTAEVLERFDLTELSDRIALGLSGGQQRRLAVALALAGRPHTVFLDEPTAGMDATARRSLLRDIGAFAADGGAVLLTTQQLAEAEEVASRVVLLARGRILLEGTVAEVRARAGLARVTVRAAELPPLPSVASVESSFDRHVVYVEDADAFVAGLVQSGVAFRELEVTPVSLEDAFVTLVSEADE
ncbi:ATP-binding cassette domain-containing protein [Gaiella sp.]|uniref:ATP-binding cassette domain-containing protein n=1 Tax=Gaiella sp. TaxID=2663207 RepID=UPI002E3582C2|nr:ATP-binding cassette domain-containing protein [Gaiella sp.]HEX5585458.1 ATP-binding cassette domain-containing protein [Gaiella sp.]